MKRLISLAVGIVAVLCAVGVAQADTDVPGPAGSTWSHPPPANVSTIVVNNRVACTLKKCRVTVSCVSDSEGNMCGFVLALSSGGLITRPSVNLADEETGESFYPWRAAEPALIKPGETQTVRLDVIGPGKKAILKRLGKGKRTLPGQWEANRMGFIEESPGNFDFLYQYNPAPITISLPKLKKK